MTTYSFAMQPGPFTGPGCIIDNSTRTAFGFRRTRGQAPTRTVPGPRHGKFRLRRDTTDGDAQGTVVPGRVARTAKNIGIGIAVASGSFVLGAGATLGLIEVGYDKDTAATVTVAASEVAIAVTVAVVERADRRRRYRQVRETAQPTASATGSLSLPLPAQAADQPAGAN
ncbi:hypothetical protein [Streptomyces sp. NPDC055287]